MFAILFHESLTPFYTTLASFPTALWTVLLLFLLFYWIVAVLGLVEIDSLDIDLPESFETNADMGADSFSDASSTSFLAGILIRFGLYGVPFAIILSVLAIVGWLISYYGNFVANKLFATGILHYAVGLLILLISLLVAMWVTGFIVRPIRKWVAKIPKRTAKSILGKVATVRTSVVNAGFGEASVEDGGAGLVLKVRSFDTEFKQGDKVVLLEYLTEENAYRVVSESEFLHG